MTRTRPRVALLTAVAVSLLALIASAAAATRGGSSARRQGRRHARHRPHGRRARRPRPDACPHVLGARGLSDFCEKLYDLNAKAQIVPQLASALPTLSKDKLTVTIPLRKGIRFNDGTPFNATPS